MGIFREDDKERLLSCNIKLKLLFEEVIKHIDCSIICGHRDEYAQNEVRRRNITTDKYPDSKHNKIPSLAVDVMPLPIDWNNIDKINYFVGFVKGIAIKMGINIKTWHDIDIEDYDRSKLIHFELVE